MTTGGESHGCPRLMDEWEVLALDDGSVLFMSVYGEHLRIARPPAFFSRMLGLLDGTRTVAQIASALGEDPAAAEPLPAVIEAALRKLIEAGVVSQVPPAARPGWLDDRMYERFHLQIAFLNKYARADASAIDYFKRLRDAHVVIIGLGGVGSHLAMYLAAAGIGRLTLIDGDRVEASNLIRQIYFAAGDVGVTPKVDVIARRVAEFSPYTEVATRPQFLSDPEAVEAALAELRPDFLLPCADFPRVLLNRWIARACVKLRVPYMMALNSIAGPIYVPGSAPCFGCLEQLFVARASGTWPLIVDAMQRHTERQAPSVVSGPAMSALVQFLECLAFLTGAWPPSSLGHILQMGHFGVTGTEPIAIDPTCAICSEVASPSPGGA
jgi:molybdopterin-synthase adenylyltransferase